MRNKFARIPDPNSFVSAPGSPVHLLFSPRLAPDGSVSLIPSGKENIQDKIGSYLASSDMNFILNQLKGGNPDVLQCSRCSYCDTSDFPTNYRDMLQLCIDAQAEFEALPVDVRGKFDYDFHKFFSLMGTARWNDLMGFSSTPDVSVKPDKTESEVSVE